MQNLNYREVLAESKEYFDTLQVGNILGQGYFAVAGEPALFEQYLDSMTRGVSDPDTQAQIRQLMINNNKQILTESSIMGIAPIYAMSNPLVRMLYPKLHLKEAVKTIVADSPRLLVTFMAPYVEKVVEGGRVEKHYLPYDMDGALSENGDLNDLYVKKELTFGEAPVVTWDVWATDGATRFGHVASRVKFQPLDSDFTFKYIKLTGVDTPITVNARPTMVNGTIIYDYDDGTNKGKVIVTVDFAKAYVTAAYIVVAGANPESVGLIAHYSSENHEVSTSVGIESMRDEINIGTSDHISATMPAEFLADLNAMYKVSGAEELTATMSKLVELRLDKRIAKFIADCFVGQPGENTYYKHLGDNSNRFAVFNAKPPVTFNGTSRAWRDEIRTYIDDIAARIEIATYLEDGIYTVVCNPKDAQLINNIDWKFNGGATKVDGVSVSYSVGQYVGTHTYKVIASPQMAQGYIYVLFLPTGNDQLTYVYAPYSFVMESNYRDPNHMNLPSLMTTKRDAMRAFLPAIGCIQVLNNGSSIAGENVFDVYREFIPTKQVASASDELDFVETGSFKTE